MSNRKPHIRIIGDVHGVIKHRTRGRSYKTLVNGVPYSVQLGDMSLSYEDLEKIDPIKHRIVMGNHDNYDAIPPHALGDFGWHSFPLKNEEFKFFFIRGAFSIDRRFRILGRSYWENEELSWEECYKLIEVWKQEKPDLVLSHDCPAQVVPMVMTPGMTSRDLRPSRTNQVMDNLFAIHRPKLWIFGHHHQSKVMRVFDTTFICVAGQTNYSEMGFVDFDENGIMIGQRPQ